ncbi:uncharacterized protein C8A04DRAFT_37584 [Dichotomopilus funicola]|uniref:Uncharacterized protein n=1 Tax=Dichotomopilus funicola TaxID=1934379 RepID=A0AAN6V1P7_9PEZI|nr:hypothetical protein C8A04DRAFT_37584 [Dichotomopilus funicola]
MGVSLSTLVGWTVVIAAVYAVAFGIPGQKKAPAAVRGGATQRQRLEDKPNTHNRKEPKEKAKRQRGDAYSKDTEDTNKTTQVKARTTKPSAPVRPAVDDSSDDGADNREFARQLANIKQGTTLNAPKKSDEKRQKSVKQSRAQVIDDKVNEIKVSAPSSTAGVDADDDESESASPEIKATDASGVSDMLEPKASGPSVLRLTDTDKAKTKKEKKAKEPEKTETKKQRQNRQKAEAAKALREETEKARKVDMENQRRQARIAEGRPAQDGSAFTAQAVQSSAWSGNGANGTSAPSNATNGSFLPVQPLDTFETGSYTDVSLPAKNEAPAPVKAAPATKSNPADSWIATLPSEEEQMELLRDEEAWNTVSTKKTNKKKKGAAAAAANETATDSESAAVQPKPAAKTSTPAPATSNGTTAAAPAKKPTKIVSQQSAFAALSTNEPEGEEENEWDV